MKKKEDKVTIIVTNYNNFELLFDNLSLVLKQSYKNIDLIICDDGSNYFDSKKIVKYLNINKFNGDIQFVINDNNIGTVKTLNKSIPLIKGNYSLFIASDDTLFDEYSIDNYVKSFDEETDVVVLDGYEWNSDTDKCEKTISKNSIKYNDSKKIKRDICLSNQMYMGATMIKSSIIKECKFDEKYKYLEDWPLNVKLLFNNLSFKFVDKPGIKHRIGGISSETILKPSTKKFYEELMICMHDEIIPKLDQFNDLDKWKILRSYKFYCEYYSKYIDCSKYSRDLYNNIKQQYLKKYLLLDTINPHLFTKIKNIIKYNKLVFTTCVLSIISEFIIINLFNVKYLLILFISLYYIYYILLTIFNRIRRKKR